MWGNSHGALEAVIQFAQRNPNVILEFKTKSANVSHLLKNELPKNILCTWSLNTETIIHQEEHGTASLTKRLEAARAVADKGVVVGFHFHPMVHYKQWAKDYQAVIDQVTDLFNPDEVALVSLGTLTFIKPVIREIRKRGIESQILKLPLVNAKGKYSYPDEMKIEMFSHAYHCFPDEWRKQVFFYLCMEAQELWQPVFGFTYDANDDFEKAMKQAYLNKIARKKL
jgi:spore photoproduct lyase